ncbi:hypothetical protein NQ318_013307 [Aromia moschata]|uniref:Uncharacterized protein n=1 Tax=Aromia moschata TaxID=1265417 RepID=A0AAV8XZ32_9CUCU|nr:hypothetical protein NQ318_013307 [Aromia moschata]
MAVYKIDSERFITKYEYILKDNLIQFILKRIEIYNYYYKRCLIIFVCDLKSKLAQDFFSEPIYIFESVYL